VAFGSWEELFPKIAYFGPLSQIPAYMVDGIQFYTAILGHLAAVHEFHVIQRTSTEYYQQMDCSQRTLNMQIAAQRRQPVDVTIETRLPSIQAKLHEHRLCCQTFPDTSRCIASAGYKWEIFSK
jgi:hypothetical protein